MCYIREDIRRRAQGFPARIAKLAKGKNVRDCAQLERTFNNGGLQSVPYLSDNLYYIGGGADQSAMFWLFGQQIEERFADALDALAWPNNAVPLADRRARIAQIDGRLDELLLQREALVADLHAAGIAG